MSCIFADFDARRKPLRALSYISPLILPQLDNSGTNFLLEPKSLRPISKAEAKVAKDSSKGYKKPPYSLWFLIIWMVRNAKHSIYYVQDWR